MLLCHDFNSQHHLRDLGHYSLCEEFQDDRTGLTRSAVSLFFFIVVHAVGNLHLFKGPDDTNGYGYFYVRLFCTGHGFQANIVEEYVLLSALLHISAGLKEDSRSEVVFLIEA